MHQDSGTDMQEVGLGLKGCWYGSRLKKTLQQDKGKGQRRDQMRERHGGIRLGCCYSNMKHPIDFSWSIVMVELDWC
jgi:hypothetical protein